MEKREFFSSRWGLILATLGIAVGTGNIWRFSRIVAQNGGGSFLIPWLIFLLIWSLPLIITEFAIGKHTRLSPTGAIATIAGKKFTWMGAFIAFVSTAIMFYYSVISGWCLKYLISSLTGELQSTHDPLVFWNNFSSSYQPVLFHLIIISICGIIVYKGVVQGIEKVSKILVTTLILILVVLLLRAVTLPNAGEGLKYFFTPNLNSLLDHKVWLNALTQNAWDTGAGWGLIMTYAVYMKQKEDIPVNAALIGFGNNSVSLIAGILIFSTVFALGGDSALAKISESGPANTGLTFIYLPLLFNKITPFSSINYLFTVSFFLSLLFAAVTSLISMVELSTKTLIDFGLTRGKAIAIIIAVGFFFGVPSALNINIFLNQDWVWGMGLILSGAFIAFAVRKFGIDKLRTEVINASGADFKIGPFYNILMKYFIPVQALFLIVWWFISSTRWDPEWWNPFHTENLGTCVFQWSIVLATFILLNRKFVKLIFK